MLIGTLVHELLQESLRNGLRSQKEVQQQLETCLQQSSTLKSLLGLTMSQDEIRKEVEPFLPHIVFFVETYVLGKANKEPPPPAYASGQKSNASRPQIWPGTVETIKDIEENIWSPRLGIKGMVVRAVKFSSGDTKFERFLPKNEHTQRKLLNFENWCSGELSF